MMILKYESLESKYKIEVSIIQYIPIFLRTIRSQQIQRESFQRDYIYLLQTSLSAEDTRLFGGTKVLLTCFDVVYK